MSDGFMSNEVLNLLKSHGINTHDVKHVLICIGLNDEHKRKFQIKTPAKEYAERSCHAMFDYLKDVSNCFANAKIVWLGCGYIHKLKNGYPTNYFHLKNICTYAESMFVNMNTNVFAFRNIFKHFEACDINAMNMPTQSGGRKMMLQLKHCIMTANAFS